MRSSGNGEEFSSTGAKTDERKQRLSQKTGGNVKRSKRVRELIEAARTKEQTGMVGN